MDANVLKTFIAVCEYSGFSAAAKELGYTQSTVSSQIKQLEKELDVRLFDRYYHKINLTEKGVLVLQQARNILKAQAKMLDSLNSAESIEGEIRLSMSSSVCSRYFKNDFLRFHHQYPEIKVEITENGTEQMFDKLRKNETDLVFTLDRHIYDSDFIICAEQEEQVHFIAAADNPVAGCSWKLSEISQNEFVLTEQAMSYRKILNEILASQSLEIRPVLEIGNPLQICELVKNSSLLSFLPDFISEKYVKDGQIKRLDVAGCPVTVWTQLLLHKNKWRSPAINVFIEFYKEVMQYMQSLPKELLDAGRIDGCTEYGISVKIMMPITKPAFASMAILCAMGSWNNMLWPMLVFRDTSKFTLQIGLNTLLTPYGNNYNLLIAGSMFGILPILIIYLIFQRYLIDGMTSGAVKG